MVIFGDSNKELNGGHLNRTTPRTVTRNNGKRVFGPSRVFTLTRVNAMVPGRTCERRMPENSPRSSLLWAPLAVFP